MPLDPFEKSPRPRPLIIPGTGPAPEERAPRVVLPGAEDEPVGEAPRIVLPPGVASGEAEELPEYPRLRPLMIVPVNDGEREMLLVNDPLGVMPGQPVLGIEALAILQLLDGTVSLNDLTAALMRDNKDIRVANMVREFVAQLDRLLMLESPRFEAASRELREAYHRLEIRPAALEGHSYPADRQALIPFLDGHFAEAERLREAAGDAEAATDALPRALLAPHLDPRRAGPTIARAFLELGRAPAEPLRVVVFGTGHSLFGDGVALTRKHFETPLGKLPCDTEFVDHVAARLGDSAYRSELAHRDEHSIEFQVLYLLHRLGGRRAKLVPILCGGFHQLLDEGRAPREDATFEALIEAVHDAERELAGPTLYLAGVDFAHVGARFGDPAPDLTTRADIESKDRAAIEAARLGDADAWFDAIASHQDSTRICGFAPTYAMLRCAARGSGRLLHYEQSAEPDESIVSVAAMVWP